MAIRFRLLGPVEADIDGQPVDLGHARQRCVLAALLVDAGRVVPIDVLLDRVWTDRLPHHARTALYGYLSRLRRVLPDVTLSRVPGGYRLDVDPDTVDLHRFRHLITQAGTDPESAEVLLTEALRLWRGDAFATLETPWFNSIRVALDAERNAAELDRCDLALARGQHAALLAELSARAPAHPFDERLTGQLLLALYRCGRVADALHHYDEVRRRLAEELGTDPSPALQQLHQRILGADPTLTVTATTAGQPVPRQLPWPPRSFTGRERELAFLDAITDGIAAVSGTAGVGKTTLALHWAYRVAEKFDDGQLCVDLRGFDPGGSVMNPAEAVRIFLDALDVAPQRIPAGLDAQAALYRSLLAGKRMLIVLDNARDVEQVRPLLPGAPGCVVVVTSRNQLTGLVANEGAHPLTMDVLTITEARDLLARRLGPDRVAAEPEAVAEIITRCARLPLALAVVAARAAIHPTFPLEKFPGGLRADPMNDVRAVFSWSYWTLSPGAARLFRLLGLHRGPDIAAPAAASLAGLPVAEVRPPLAELARANLVIEHSPGRYTFHDLLRAYAAEQAHTHDTEADRRQASQRMLDHYLHTAHSASLLVEPYQADPIGHVPTRAGVVPEHLDDHEQAMAWFAAERQVLLAAIEHAAGSGLGSHCWRLAWTLTAYLSPTGHWHDLATVHRTALSVARECGDQLGQAIARHGQAIARHGLGIAQLRLRHHDDACTHLHHALHRGLGHHSELATVHRTIGILAETQGRYREALSHAQQSMDTYQAAGDAVGHARMLNGSAGTTRFSATTARLSAIASRLWSCPASSAIVSARQPPWTASATPTITSATSGRPLTATSALCTFRDLGNRYFVADTLTRLGDTRHAAGDLDAAHEAWRQALAILTEFDHPDADDVRAKPAGRAS